MVICWFKGDLIWNRAVYRESTLRQKGLLSTNHQTHPRTSLKSTQRKGGIWGLFGESTAKLFGARATGRQSRTRV